MFGRDPGQRPAASAGPRPKPQRWPAARQPLLPRPLPRPLPRVVGARGVVRVAGVAGVLWSSLPELTVIVMPDQARYHTWLGSSTSGRTGILKRGQLFVTVVYRRFECGSRCLSPPHVYW